MTDTLVLNGIEKRYGDTQAVGGLDVQVPPGCIYGFLGPNGSGKTTSIRMVMDIIQPDKGSVSILGASSAREVKHRIGYMPEERGLYRKMRVTSMLNYIGSIKGIPRKRLKTLVPELLERVELDGSSKKRVEELSRGMHQKLQFLTTVINNPDLMILDEPFSGLDPVNLDMLKQMMIEKRDEGKTVIFSTHLMEQAELICDSILLINGGKKVLDGPLNEIKANHETGLIELDATGDSAFIDEMAMTQSVAHNNGTLEIVLRPDEDPQKFLSAIAGQIDIRRFEIKTPTLREIFVEHVGDGHE